MGKSVLSFLLIILITAGLIFTAIYGLEIGSTTIIPSVTDQEHGIKRGLDLVGGSSITYEAQVAEGTSAEAIKDGMDSTVAMIQQRLTGLGYTEATVQKSGDRRVVVEIPAVKDPEEAVKKLGSTAQLEFRDADGNVVLSGTDVSKAAAKVGKLEQNGGTENYVELTFTKDAVAKFAEATKKAAARASENKNYIAIVLDNEVVSQPSVKEEINSETCIISGSFQAKDTKWLAGIITAGKMPFTLKDVQMSSIGPTLGEKSLETSLWAGLIGILIVMLFMLIIYRLPGLVSVIALTTYVSLVALILSIFKVNLSLPGIAGIILSIGMAVDANVIIFERIKEELRVGKTLRAAVKSGFHRAFTAILDSNVTTLIGASVLWVIGTGPIVGFAITLFIGVVVSMFTAVVVSRFLLNSLIDMNIRNLKAYGA